jgi:hypothetical protein
MNTDRRARDLERARFTRRASDRPDRVDFGDLPTVPMDLYPQDNAIPTGEAKEIGTIDAEQWPEFVDAVEGRGA